MANRISSFIDRFKTSDRSDSALVKLTLPQLKSMLDQYDLDFSVKNQEVVVHPKGSAIGHADIDGFAQLWFETSTKLDPKNEKDRIMRYELYRLMDTNCTEAIMTLDTYADESVVSGIMNTDPIKIEISDAVAKEKVLKILEHNGIYSPHNAAVAREEIRNLSKYGDRYYKVLKLSTSNEDIRILKIDKPELCSLSYDPLTGLLTGYKIGKQEFFPWEVIHSRVPSDTFSPYGRSILEPMRNPYQQLVVNEALLALSRASRVERLVISVPTPQSDPTSAFQNLLQMRGRFKNAIFGGSQPSAKSRVTGLTDILWMPSNEGYEIDRLQSSIDVGTIDDVEYFYNKFLTGTRLPKGYLLADDTIRVEEGTLSAQDLKFSRALMPVQDGYVEGLTKLCVVLLVLLDYDIEKVDVKVSMARPQALNNAMIQTSTDNMQLANDLVDSFAQVTQDDGSALIDPENWVSLVHTITGLPKELLNLISKGLKNQEPEAGQGSEGTGPGTIYSSTDEDTLKDYFHERSVCTTNGVLGIMGESIKDLIAKEKSKDDSFRLSNMKEHEVTISKAEKYLTEVVKTSPSSRMDNKHHESGAR